MPTTDISSVVLPYTARRQTTGRIPGPRAAFPLGPALNAPSRALDMSGGARDETTLEACIRPQSRPTVRAMDEGRAVIRELAVRLPQQRAPGARPESNGRQPSVGSARFHDRRESNLHQPAGPGSTK